jgi:predicted esterase
MLSSFRHQFIPSAHPAPAPCLLMLHGTGGDENDLLPLGQALDPTSALLSPRGKVLENGMARYFRRVEEGVFDVEDLKARAHELADWVETAVRTYGVDPGSITAVGYSNGANIASAMMLLRPEVLARAILFRPMIPFAPAEAPDLSLVKVLLLGGRRDPIATPQDVEGLAEILRRADADVHIHWSDAGHSLEPGDIEEAKTWLMHPHISGRAPR